MIKNNKDGIVFDSTVYLSEEKYRKFPLYMRLLQVLAIYIGSYCFITIFIKSFDIHIINSYLLSAIILTGTVFYLLILCPGYKLIKLISALAVYGGVIYYWSLQLKNGFFLLENAIIKRASKYYGILEFRFIADRTTVDNDITLLLIVIIIPVVGILSLSLIYGKYKILCYIIMLIPVVGSFAMGITPPEIDLISYILVLLFISISNGFSHNESSLHKSFGKIQKSMIYRISIRSALMLCVITLILFWGIKQFVPVSIYNDYNKINEAKTKVQSFMMDFSIRDVSDKLANVRWNIRPGRIESSGGLGLGALGRVDEVTYDDAEHLKVTVPLKSVIEGIYLKGYIGSVYTGDSWETHSKPIQKNYEDMIAGIPKEEFEPAMGSSMLLSRLPYRYFIRQGRIDITYLLANKKYVYAPYYTVLKDKAGISYENDLAAISDTNMKTVTYDYSYNISELSNLSNDFTLFTSGILHTEDTKFLRYSEHELKYRKFVYDTYTRLPENGLDRLKSDFSREQVGGASDNLTDAIDYVKDYLNRFTRYTLSPGRLPKNKDFVEYFIYENKIGYCSHFASAGAIMLRAMGYPARYVEGYAINRSDLEDLASLYIGETESEYSTVDITVKDYNAHAWVEVYYDGFGWIPVEFTTGSEMDDLVETIGNMERFNQGTTDNDANDTLTKATPSPTIVPEEEVAPPAVVPGQDEDLNASNLLNENNDNAQGFRWYLTAIPILLAGIVIYLIYISKKSKELTMESHSRKALRLFKKIERLFIFGKCFPNKSMSLEENEEFLKENINFISVKEFELCMDAVKKARFGKESISLKEYITVENFYNTLLNRIYERLPRIQKIYLKITQQI